MGAFASLLHYNAFAYALASAGYHAITVDNRGIGKSTTVRNQSKSRTIKYHTNGRFLTCYQYQYMNIVLQ